MTPKTSIICINFVLLTRVLFCEYLRARTLLYMYGCSYLVLSVSAFLQFDELLLEELADTIGSCIALCIDDGGIYLCGPYVLVSEES